MRTIHTITVYATGHNLVTGRAKEKIFPISIAEETWNGKKAYYVSNHLPCILTIAFNVICRTSKLEQLVMEG